MGNIRIVRALAGVMILVVLSGFTACTAAESTTAAEPVQKDFSMPTPEPTATPAPTEEIKGPAVRYGVELPLELADGKLTLVGLLTATLMNPDAGNAYGTDVAAIELKNTSEEHLRSCSVTIVTADEKQLSFTIEDLPAGKTVRAFETTNQSVAEETEEYVNIDCTCSFASDTPVRPEEFTFECSGTRATVTNISESTWANLAIDFHTLVDAENGLYYGGKTVTGTVKTIKPGESVSIDVYWCYMGTADPVRVRQGT